MIRQAVAGLAAGLLLLSACGSDPQTPAPDDGERTFRVGFSAFAPRLTIEDVVATIEMWSARADIALMHVSVPWAELLDGETPAEYVERELVDLAGFYRNNGFPIVFITDATDGLARNLEAEPLRERGRSIAEPEIQALYIEWIMAVVTLLEPDYLGLAAETNMNRAYAPGATYDGLVEMTSAAAAQVNALDDPPALFVSVQVDLAWGRLGGEPGYVGIAQDLADFPYVDVLGLSSYPYLAGVDTPDELPIDYYDRLRDEAGIDVMVVEGGWPSASSTEFQTSPAEQAEYLRRQARLLNEAGALALFQLTFTDIDLASFEPPPPEILSLFATLGLVDTDYQPKPALAVWDSIHQLPLLDR